MACDYDDNGGVHDLREFNLGSLFTPGKLFQHAKDEGQDSSNR